MMRDWPLPLVAALLFLGAAARVVAVDTFDVFAAILMALGSASLGGWLVTIGSRP